MGVFFALQVLNFAGKLEQLAAYLLGTFGPSDTSSGQLAYCRRVLKDTLPLHDGKTSGQLFAEAQESLSELYEKLAPNEFAAPAFILALVSAEVGPDDDEFPTLAELMGADGEVGFTYLDDLRARVQETGEYAGDPINDPFSDIVQFCVTFIDNANNE